MKRKISEAHRAKLRENIKKAHAARWAKKSKTKPKKEKAIDPSSNGHLASLQYSDYKVLEEILHNCALAGLTLTNIKNTYIEGEELRQLGSAIGEVCLEGIQYLKTAKIHKKPGRPKDAKKIDSNKKKSI